MARRIALAFAAILALTLPSGAEEVRYEGLFDVTARMAELKQPNMKALRTVCAAPAYPRKVLSMTPVQRLEPTEAYGTDDAAEDFAWTVMALGGAALGGDADARDRLTGLLHKWAKAGAFLATEENYDPYYALKRTLTPMIVGYQVVAPRFAPAERDTVRNWIDTLVRRIDKRFDREVDLNNHRILADSVIALWGSVIGDEALVAQGMDRFDQVLEEMRPDGTLELEARRGARALWYQRQTLASLTVIAEVARGRGLDLYTRRTEAGLGFPTLLGALLNGLDAPLLVTAYSAENHIPGPEKDFLALDRSFLDPRGHDRHYMAWAEAARLRGTDLSQRRLAMLFDREVRAERPLVDEFIGGNATCFWGQP